MPPLPIQKSQVLFGRLFGVEQGRDHDNSFRPKSRCFNVNVSLSNHEEVRKRSIGFPIHRSNRGRFLPANDVIVFAQPFSFAKIRFTVGFVEAADEFEATLLKHRNSGPIRHQSVRQENVSG